jgi:HAD superfamily hydrolase (TIGR01450 family)
MCPSLEPTPFAHLVHRYRVLFFDAYGVLKVSGEVLPGVADLLARLEAEERPCWVVTNDASRPPEELSRNHGGLIPPERFVSSGLLATEHLRTHHPGRRVAYLGPAPSADYITRAGSPAVPFVDVGGPGEFDVAALMDEAGFDWQVELNRLVNFLRARPEVPLLAPNPDLLFPWVEGEVRLAAGALAAVLERVLGREALSFGKPDAPIFEHALRLARTEVPDLENDEVLMVGDSLRTDVAGGARLGLATALVLSGNTPPDAYRAAIEREGIRPTHVVQSVGG